MSEATATSDHLLGSVMALTHLVALVAKEIPLKKREKLIETVAALQAVYEAEGQGAADRGIDANAIGRSETYRVFLEKAHPWRPIAEPSLERRAG
jgi:hypothetical protein